MDNLIDSDLKLMSEQLNKAKEIGKSNKKESKMKPSSLYEIKKLEKQSATIAHNMISEMDTNKDKLKYIIRMKQARSGRK